MRNAGLDEAQAGIKISRRNTNHLRYTDDFIGRTDAEALTPILWPPDGTADSLEKTIMLGKIEGGRRRGRQRMRWFDGITDSMNMNLSRL